MIKDKTIEAVYIATDAPSHARLAIMALEHGKHACSAVPAVFGFEAEDEAEELFNAVKKSGMKYMLNETSTFHAALYEKRMQYQAGALGKILYSEGEYYHDGVGVLGSYNPKNVVSHACDGLLYFGDGRAADRGVRLGDEQSLSGLQGWR